MVIGLLFWTLALLSCASALIFGGRDGRWGAGLIIAASLLTIPAWWIDRSWHTTGVARFAVDALLLLGLYALMLNSRRYWPIWMTGLHLVAFTTHLGTIAAPGFAPSIYRAFQSFWAVPVLLSLFVGPMLDHLVERGGGDGSRRDRKV